MKKMFLFFTLILSMLVRVTAFSQEPEGTKFYINGESKALSVEPYISNDTLMVPVVDLVQIMSSTSIIPYQWDAETNTAFIETTYNGILEVTLGKKEAVFYVLYGKNSPNEGEIVTFKDGDKYIVNEKFILESAPQIKNGKMTVPLSFLQSFHKDFAVFDHDKDNNILHLHLTYSMACPIPIIKVYPDEKRIDTMGFTQKYYMNKDRLYFNGDTLFDINAFAADFSGVKDGKGIVTLTGKDYPERKIKLTVDKGFATKLADNFYAGPEGDFRRLAKDTYEETGTVTENDEYTEFTSNKFRIRIFCDKVYEADSVIAPRAEIEYMGPNDEFYFSHSSPYFVMSLSGGKYDIGGFVNDVGLSSVMKKGEIYKFQLHNGGGYSRNDPDADYWREFYSKDELVLPKGEYTVYGRFEGENLADGKNIEAGVERKITVK